MTISTVLVINSKSLSSRGVSALKSDSMDRKFFISWDNRNEVAASPSDGDTWEKGMVLCSHRVRVQFTGARGTYEERRASRELAGLDKFDDHCTCLKSHAGERMSQEVRERDVCALFCPMTP